MPRPQHRPPDRPRRAVARAARRGHKARRDRDRVALLLLAAINAGLLFVVRPDSWG